MKSGRRMWKALIAGGLLALALPGAAAAEVPRDGDTLKPRTGAELFEAAQLISAGAVQPAQRWRIELAAATYALNAPVVLRGERAVPIVGPRVGKAVITNAFGPGPLLQIGSAESHLLDTIQDATEHIDFKLHGTSDAKFAAVEVFGGGFLAHSSITIPATTPNATGLRLVPSAGSGGDALANDVLIDSAATGAPAVFASPGTSSTGLDAIGGAPTLSLAEGTVTTDAASPRVLDSVFTSRGTTGSVVRIASAAQPLWAMLGSSVIDGRSGVPTLIDIRGATIASGRGWHVLRNLTTLGTAGSTAISITPGAESEPMDVLVPGLLSLGSAKTVDCLGAARVQKMLVFVTGVYRDGEESAGETCTINESGRRTGPLNFVGQAHDDLRPAWGSTLIDGARNTSSFPYADGAPYQNAWSDFDLAGGARERQVEPGYNASNTVDIGAYEYQHAAPVIDHADWGQIGNRGLTDFYVDTHDDDPGETDDLVITWTLPDGTKIHDAGFTHRFATPGTVQLEVRDRAGLTDGRTFDVYPWIVPAEPATDDPSYVPTPPTPDPPVDDPTPIDDEPFPGDNGIGGTPSFTPRPRPTPTPAPATPRPQSQPIAPKVKVPTLTSATILSSRISRKAVLPTGWGKARAGEAAISVVLARETDAVLTATKIVGGAAGGSPAASTQLRRRSGTQLIRVSAKLGRTKLSLGVYRISISLTGPTGAERRDFMVRVRR